MKKIPEVIEKKVMKVVDSLLDDLHNDGVSTPELQRLVEITSTLPILNLEQWHKKFNYILWEKSRKGRKHLPSVIPWLDCCNGDGYIREKVLLSMKEGAPNGFLFSLALRRLNDWVPQVRQAARTCIPLIALKTNSEFIVDALWGTLPYLSTWGRLESSERNVLLNLLSIEEVVTCLISRLTSATSGPLVSILSQAGRVDSVDRFLPAISTNAVVPSLRAKAVKTLLENEFIWIEGRAWVMTDPKWCKLEMKTILGSRILNTDISKLEIICKATKDSSAIVRRVAGDGLVKYREESGLDAKPLAELLAKDTYPSIIERGTFVLDKLQQKIHMNPTISGKVDKNT